MTSVLFVDDEPAVLRSLKRAFRGYEDWEYYFADSPKEAIEILSTHNITVLVSDHRMPRMTGAEFLAHVKKKRPNTIRIMLTGQADLEAVQKAVNSGEIYRFLLKPWKDEDLKSAIRNGVELYEMRAENERLQKHTQQQNQHLSETNVGLEERVKIRNEQLTDALHTAQNINRELSRSLMECARSIFRVFEQAQPDLGGHCRRVAKHSHRIGELLGISGNEMEKLEIAALLHDIGKLGMPLYLLEKSPEDYREDEFKLYTLHSRDGASYLESIEQFADVCRIITEHHERYDGAGFPARKRGLAIGMEAYVVGMADWLDHLLSKPTGDPQFRRQYASHLISESSDEKFPARVVDAVNRYIDMMRLEEGATASVRVELSGLMPRMTLAANVYTLSGTMLLAAGSELSVERIQRLRSIARVDPIAGDIYVYPRRVDGNHRRRKEDQTAV